MENSSQLSRWIRSTGKPIGLKIIESTWPEKYKIPVRSLRAHLELGGEKYNGFGTAADLAEALNKSVGELLERIAILCYFKTDSTGFAFHTDLKKCEENAINELVERTLFRANFQQGGFPSVVELAVEEMLSLSQGHPLSQGRAFEISLGVAQGIHCVACCVIGVENSLPFGVCLGLGASSSLDQALKKARTELLVDLVNFHLQGDINFSEFNQKDRESFDSSTKRWNVAYGKKFFEMYCQSETSESLVLEFSINTQSWAYQKIVPSIPIDGFIAKAESAEPTFANQPTPLESPF